MNAERYVALMVTELESEFEFACQSAILDQGPIYTLGRFGLFSQAFQMQVKLKRKFGREKSIEAHQARFQ